jgi:hypothetical protein
MSLHFDPPPRVIAELVVAAILFIITTIQLAITNFPKYTSRMPSGHRFSRSAITTTLAFWAAAYGLDITRIATVSTTHDFGDSIVSLKNIDNMNIASALFTRWADILLYVAVAVVLRDRYLASTRKTIPEYSSKGGPPLLPFIVGSSIIFLFMFVFGTANIGLWGSTLIAVDKRPASLDEVRARIKQVRPKVNIARHLYYVFIAMSAIAVVFLCVFAVVVKRRNRSDKITTLTLKVIMPILTLWVTAEIILAILNAQLPKKPIDIQLTLSLARSVVYGVFHTAATSMLAYFLTVPRLWGAPASLTGSFDETQQSIYKGGVAPALNDA